MKDGMVIKGEWSNFLDIEGEELLLVKRKHAFVLLAPVFLHVLLFTVFSAALFFIFNFLFSSFALFIVSFLLLLNIAVSLIIYSFVYWYFHLYVLTSKKILEVRYTPLSSHIVNDIFLDKVNSTEIDLSSKGFFHELIDMGDVTITFDRPTHQEEFVLQNIKNCDEVAKYLTQKLMEAKRGQLEETLWFRRRSNLLPKAAI